MKQCRACDEEKPLSAFRSDGRTRCRQCEIKIATRLRDDRQIFSYSAKRCYSALDDARLLTLDAIGVPLDAIAVLIERPFSGAEARLTLLRERLFKESKRAQHEWTAERIADLRDMIGIKGFSRSQAGKVLGVTRNAAIGAAQRHLPELCGKRVVNALIQRRA